MERLANLNLRKEFLVALTSLVLAYLAELTGWASQSGDSRQQQDDFTLLVFDFKGA